MAIKRFCDKCGGETRTGLYRLRVEVICGDDSSAFDDGSRTSLDLCVECLKKIFTDACERNPGKP